MIEDQLLELQRMCVDLKRKLELPSVSEERQQVMDASLREREQRVDVIEGQVKQVQETLGDLVKALIGSGTLDADWSARRTADEGSSLPG